MNRHASLRRAAGLAIEWAGVVGLVATLALFGLAGFGWTEHYFWQAAGVAVLGNTLFVLYQLAQWLTGVLDGGWRTWLLASLVPGIALALTLLLAASNLGVAVLPWQKTAPTAPPPHTIQLGKARSA